jgi:hypothetical protein
MAEVIWTEPALQDLDAIADYIAIEDPRAARGLVERVFRHVEQLVEPPCRIFYRYDGRQVFIIHLMRGERQLRRARLAARKSGKPGRGG